MSKKLAREGRVEIQTHTTSGNVAPRLCPSALYHLEEKRPFHASTMPC
jgi:hypothetical protein